MIPEEEIRLLEAKLKSIPGWLTVIVLLERIRKLKLQVEEKTLGYFSEDIV